MDARPLGPFTSSSVALGCMNFSHAYGHPVSAEQAHAVIGAALDAGVTMFDTATLYGFGANERLVGPVLNKHRSRITLASKCGMGGVKGDDGVVRRVIDGAPATLRQQCEDSLQRLGTDVIDLYYLHRWDPRVPIEESVGELARLKAEGKIRAIGLSEVGVEQLRRAHQEHPITALQSEYSLWSRNAELGTLQACQELGVAYVAFSPMGRGYLSGKVQDVTQFVPGDIRSAMPRFKPENYARNLALLAPMQAIAQRVGCTLAELAMGWVQHQGEHIIALPGTTSVEHLQENIRGASVQLSAEVLAELNTLFAPDTIAGDRYALQGQREVFTEKYAFEATGL